MKFTVLLVLCLAGSALADLFDFFNGQFGHHQQQQQQQQQVSLEDMAQQSNCNKYLCPDTLLCVSGPKECPCPYQTSQLRCVLPNGEYLCISKPFGDFGDKYDDPKKNWKVDAQDDNVRDCGWVKRAWSGNI